MSKNAAKNQWNVVVSENSEVENGIACKFKTMSFVTEAYVTEPAEVEKLMEAEYPNLSLIRLFKELPEEYASLPRIKKSWNLVVSVNQKLPNELICNFKTMAFETEASVSKKEDVSKLLENKYANLSLIHLFEKLPQRYASLPRING